MLNDSSHGMNTNEYSSWNRRCTSLGIGTSRRKLKQTGFSAGVALRVIPYSFLIGILLLLSPRTCVANTTTTSTTFPSELASPWTTRARPWLLGGVAATTLILIAGDHIEDSAQRRMATQKPLGSSAKFGDYAGQLIPNVAYVVGMLSYGLIANDDLARERSFTLFKATLYAVSISTGLKLIVREPRPNDSKNLNSFPSGHATSVFAFASYVAAEHQLAYGVAAFGLAIFSGLSRMNDNKHHFHDVVAGATIGTAYGLGMSYLHSAAREEKSKQTGKYPTQLQIVPIFSSDSKGAALVAEF